MGMTNAQNGGKIIKLGNNITSFDVTSVYAGYGNLTNDNFLIVPTGTVNTQGTYVNQGNISTCYYKTTYNKGSVGYSASTGALTITRPTSVAGGQVILGDDSGVTLSNATVNVPFSVYLVVGVE